ncbi:prenylated flavin chaperone LpdD [Sediminispirochaeta smaragdinae]|uniref:Prenylated flavin chaperone LpdD-like domain-containing protein n=1 Tax=Sediminispirochaeta smaragdinae (strain DSM 11293 / JCM 15392 / SEBR 4228) TaxID=573413 RepID=E1R2B4_SEDSS|nr:hypothetical protein [Sediminispirochaeta smaragdinae]ADK82474.1 conserved hypothetical protein [Sediminispirochaeta smaragdinae DSM 11293]
MIHKTVVAGRAVIEFTLFQIGEDLLLVIAGGQTPHIGAVTLSLPRKSLTDDGSTSSSTSVLAVPAHKDDEIARSVSAHISSRLNRNVVVACGIHIDHASSGEIERIIGAVDTVIAEIIGTIGS